MHFIMQAVGCERHLSVQRIFVSDHRTYFNGIWDKNRQILLGVSKVDSRLWTVTINYEKLNSNFIEC